MTALYGARTIKRDRRTRTRIDQLDAQILAVLREDHPQSVRHVFYRMTDPRLPEPVEKSDRGYRHVQNRCVLLRRDGRVPFGWIEDATRRGYFTATYSSGADFVRSMAGYYRADLWAQADCRCEIWVESRSIAGVVHGLCTELAVSLYPSGGFSSLSFIHEAARAINDQDDGRPLVVFYIGDYDPAGVLIDRKIEEGLREHLNDNVTMTFHRLGITREQVTAYDLPTKPRKASDRRAPEVEFTVEAEAMPAHLLRRILREAIEALLPHHALRIARIAEDSEKEGLQLLADAMERAA